MKVICGEKNWSTQRKLTQPLVKHANSTKKDSGPETFLLYKSKTALLVGTPLPI